MQDTVDMIKYIIHNINADNNICAGKTAALL